MKQRNGFAWLPLLLVIGVVGALGVSLWSHYEINKKLSSQTSSFGSSPTALPQVNANFVDSLATQEATADTSFTLVSGKDTLSRNLSGFYCFTVDPQTASAEFECGTASGTAISSVTRGIDPLNWNATSSSLIFLHRRGAAVVLTDYTPLGALTRLLQGADTLPNTLTYLNHPTSTASTTIEDKNYVDNIAIAGSPSANNTVPGIGLVANNSQIQSSAATGNISSTAYSYWLSSGSDSPQPTISAPTGLALATGTVGSIPSGTYYYELTAVSQTGETTPSAAVTTSVPGATSSVTVSWNIVQDALYYNIYRAVTSTFPSSSFIASTTALSFVDTLATSSTGTPPLVNLSGTGATTTIVATKTNGKISGGFIAQDASTSYNFLGSITSASSTLNNTTTLNNAIVSSLTNTIVYATGTHALQGIALGNGLTLSGGNLNSSIYISNGHIITSGATSTVSSCGTVQSVTGNDTSETISTNASSLTSCHISFATSYTNIPACVPWTGFSVTTPPYLTSVSNSGFTINFSSISGNPVLLGYLCLGAPN